MKTRSFFHHSAITLASLCIAASFCATAAEFHPISSITSSTAIDDLYPAINLIQGPDVGFSATDPFTAVPPTTGSLWVTAAPGGATDYYIATGDVPPVLLIDLGSDVLLFEISTWGYSSTNSNGAKDFSLRFATDAEGPSAIGDSIDYNPTFIADLDPLTRDSHLFSQLVTARYVEVTAFDNYGGEGLPGGDRVGLGEIAFEVSPAEPTISVSSTLSLAPTSTPTTQGFPLNNIGQAPLTITGLSITGPNAAAFIASAPLTIPANSTSTLTVEFDPTGLLGPISATLSITSNDPATPTAQILISGTAIPTGPQISASDPVIDRTLASTKTTIIPVENTGGSTLTISNTSLSGPNAAAFSITAAPNSIAPGGTANVEVQIDPAGLQGLISATLTISSNDPITPSKAVLIEAVALGDTAEFFPITSITSSTAATDLWPASNLIQGPGSGFDAATPYTKLLDGDVGNWVTSDPGGFPSDYIAAGGKPILIFDLGQDVPLGEVSVWGYDATNSNGTSEFSLRFATSVGGPSSFGTTLTYNPFFAGIDSGELLNTDNTSRFSFPFEEGVVARYIEFTNEDNFFIAPGNGGGGELPGGDRVGLGEVAFAVLGSIPGNQFAITSIELIGADVSLVFTSRPGLTYGIFRSTDLASWEELDDSFPSGGDSSNFVDDEVPAAPRVFYQIRPGE